MMGALRTFTLAYGVLLAAVTGYILFGGGA